MFKMTSKLRVSHAGCALLAALVYGAGCGGEPPPQKEVTAESRSALDPAALNTFINKSIEIDQAGSDLSNPADANLFVGNDPADGTASQQKPTGGPAPFIDWNDLGGDLANHRLLDLNNAAGKDDTSFPQSNECVATSSVLSKMDLTYVASANNNQYGYFAVQRSSNNGDAGYYWIFTKKSPHLDAGEAPCGAAQKRLTYDITGSTTASAARDVLLVGHFHPNSTPALRVFRAKKSTTKTDAVSAINYQDTTLWEEVATGVAAVAVNTTVTRAGAFGADGVVKTALTGTAPNINIDTELFAEAAVPMSVFTGGSSTCGSRFFGSVITRSSGSGGTSPDLKDLAGPAEFNFGSIAATAALTPTCTNAFGYTASGTGTDGNPLASPTCTWTCDSGPAPTGCSGSVTGAALGSRTCTVTVTDPASGCTATSTPAPVRVCSGLSVTPTMTGTCSLSLGYTATPGGGCGTSTCGWAFGSGVTPGTSSTCNGSAAVGVGDVDYTGTVTVTDGRTDIACTATGTATARPYAPLAIHIAPTTAAPVCQFESDAVTYGAAISGGKQPYNVSWTNGCSGSSCVIDPPDGSFCHSESFSATVTDSSGNLCPPATSETETYSKITTITATNN